MSGAKGNKFKNRDEGRERAEIPTPNRIFVASLRAHGRIEWYLTDSFISTQCDSPAVLERAWNTLLLFGCSTSQFSVNASTSSWDTRRLNIRLGKPNVRLSSSGGIASRRSCVADRLPVVVRFPAGPASKTQDRRLAERQRARSLKKWGSQMFASVSITSHPRTS